jgi:hypothetical protein
MGLFEGSECLRSKPPTEEAAGEAGPPSPPLQPVRIGLLPPEVSTRMGRGGPRLREEETTTGAVQEELMT